MGLCQLADLFQCHKSSADSYHDSDSTQDERHPNARWCPRPGCDQLIVCETAGDFTCPACGARGCFHCRKFAHRFWFCWVKTNEDDASYLAWEKSVGDGSAVRPCPQCKMRIWKADGCVVGWLFGGYCFDS